MSSQVAQSNRLRTWRTEKGLTQQEISDLTGYSLAMVSRLERGQRQPSVAAKVRIARGLGVRICDLFDVVPGEPA